VDQLRRESLAVGLAVGQPGLRQTKAQGDRRIDKVGKRMDAGRQGRCRGGGITRC